MACSAAETVFDSGAFTTMTPRGCSRDVDIVEPDARTSDHGEVTTGCEHRGRDLRRRADDEGLGTTNRFEELLGLQSGLDIDNVTRGAQQLEAAV